MLPMPCQSLTVNMLSCKGKYAVGCSVKNGGLEVASACPSFPLQDHSKVLLFLTLLPR